jgi:hypothetical protein
MKKILVVLLILAVAGGVFAQQGDWSIGGKVVVGTRLDFNPKPDVDAVDDPALVDGVAYWGWDQQHGELKVNYDRGIVHVGTTIHAPGDNVFDVTFNGDNYRGQVRMPNLIAALSGGTAYDRLWGEFKFVNGLVTVEAAANSQDAEYWVSDKTGAFFGTKLANTPAGSGDTSGAKDWRVDPKSYIGNDNPYFSGWKTSIMFEESLGNGDVATFTKVDHHNYLRVAADIGSLGFGVMVPNLFVAPSGWGSGPNELLAHALPYTVLGVSFNQAPLEIAAQFLMKNYAIYFGGRFFAGPITVGLSFTGVLDANSNDNNNDSDPKVIKIGGRVDYSGGSFGGGIKGFYSRNEVPYDLPNQKGYVSIVGIEPTFFINAIPSHLRFDLNLGMYFLSDIDNSVAGSETKDKEVIWAVQPQVWWNFLGTGATSNYWGDFNTGIIFRYRLAVADLREMNSAHNASFGSKQGANFLDIVFKLGY